MKIWRKKLGYLGKIEEILSTTPLTVKSAQKQKVLDSFEFLQYSTW